MMRPFHLVPAALGPELAAARGEAPATEPALGTMMAPVSNPMTGSSTLRFQLATPGDVEIDLYNVSGQRVKQLVGGWFEAGDYTVAWNASGESGAAVPSGVYFLQMRTEGITRSQRVVVVQ